jgi:hypothetical protein
MTLLTHKFCSTRANPRPSSPPNVGQALIALTADGKPHPLRGTTRNTRPSTGPISVHRCRPVSRRAGGLEDNALSLPRPSVLDIYRDNPRRRTLPQFSTRPDTPPFQLHDGTPGRGILHRGRIFSSSTTEVGEALMGFHTGDTKTQGLR